MIIVIIKPIINPMIAPLEPSMLCNTLVEITIIKSAPKIDMTIFLLNFLKISINLTINNYCVFAYNSLSFVRE